MDELFLRIVREVVPGKPTFGSLSASCDGGPWEFVCWTLEDPVREIPGRPVSSWKIPKETAIPFGAYRVSLTMSNRFKVVLPLLCDVPGFTGVRLHGGNTDEDTEGCPLVAHRRNSSRIWQSATKEVVRLVGSSKKASILIL
jgi:hypothetical protein